MTGLLTSQLLMRKDTAANWTSTNPVLADGEIGHETDTLFHKIGDGSTAWNSLIYYHGPPWLQGLDGGAPDSVYAVGPDSPYHGAMSTDPGPVPPPDDTQIWAGGTWRGITCIYYDETADEILVAGLKTFGDTNSTMRIMSKDGQTYTDYTTIPFTGGITSICRYSNGRVYILRSQPVSTQYLCYYSDAPYTTWTLCTSPTTAFSGHSQLAYDRFQDKIWWAMGTKLFVADGGATAFSQQSYDLFNAGSPFACGECQWWHRWNFGASSFWMAGGSTLGGPYAGRERFYRGSAGASAPTPNGYADVYDENDAFGASYGSKDPLAQLQLPDETVFLLGAGGTIIQTVDGTTWTDPLIDLSTDGAGALVSYHNFFAIPAFGKIYITGVISGGAHKWYESDDDDGTVWVESTDIRLTPYIMYAAAAMSPVTYTHLDNGGIAFVDISPNPGFANQVIITV